MAHITKKHISTGVTWVAIEEADLFMCCGCPADTVKHLKKAGLIHTVVIDGFTTENGPNAILLSDALIQNGQVANLTEFPILHMLYLQGVNLPNHPNYQKSKPILIGNEDQIHMQLEYVSVGNHGLSTLEEIEEAGISHENAKKIFTTKLHYSGGKIKLMQELVSSCILSNEKKELKNGVFIQRLSFNNFQISYKNEQVIVDLNLKEHEHFLAPYKLPFRKIRVGRFSITHTGEGNGGDKNRPCMASLIHHEDKFYLIDAGPNILGNLSFLGVGLSEIDGIFLSHIHDDHFAGITELLNVERKLNFYATKLIRRTAEKKLKALMNSELDLIQMAFNCIDLEFGTWNSINGLEVKPVFSPHTVETSTFSFRVLDNGDYKTYTHLSDTINLTEFKVIIESSPDVFTREDVSSVKSSYLSKVNLKKIDVGGGSIHGHLSDYENDESDLLVLAHTSVKMKTEKDNFINVDFGDTHQLIEDKDLGFLKTKSIIYLKRYFNTLEDAEIQILADRPFKQFLPGQTILSKGGDKKMLLILSGLVYYTDDAVLEQTLDGGNFIGYSLRYFRHTLPEKYVAKSYGYYLEYDESFINQFIQKFSLIDEINTRVNIMKVLRESELISDSFSNAIYNRFGKYASLVDSQSYDFSNENIAGNIFIITEGNMHITFRDKSSMQIGSREHFGGLDLLRDQRRKQFFTFDEEIHAISIPIDKLEIVPKLLWRLIELEEKRYQLSIFKAK